MAAPAKRSERRSPTRRIAARAGRQRDLVTTAPFDSPRLTISSRQGTKAIDLRLLRKIVESLFREFPQVEDAELDLLILAAPEMTRLNETFLQHAGSTDVIAFDYSDHASLLHGEIFLCVDEAILQARRFRTTWQSELVRYLIHGVLHLLGHDDHRALARRRMKREESRLLKSLSSRFALSRLARKPRLLL